VVAKLQRFRIEVPIGETLNVLRTVAGEQVVGLLLVGVLLQGLPRLLQQHGLVELDPLHGCLSQNGLLINSRKQCIPFIWSVRSVKNVTLYIIYLYISGNLRLFRAEFGWG